MEIIDTETTLHVGWTSANIAGVTHDAEDDSPFFSLPSLLVFGVTGALRVATSDFQFSPARPKN